MFSCEIRVNGAMVGHLYCRNLGKKEKDTYQYYYEYYRPESGQVQTGKIFHAREDGIESLTSRILEKIST